MCLFLSAFMLFPCDLTGQSTRRTPSGTHGSTQSGQTSETRTQSSRGSSSQSTRGSSQGSRRTSSSSTTVSNQSTRTSSSNSRVSSQNTTTQRSGTSSRTSVQDSRRQGSSSSQGTRVGTGSQGSNRQSTVNSRRPDNGSSSRPADNNRTGDQNGYTVRPNNPNNGRPGQPAERPNVRPPHNDRPVTIPQHHPNHGRPVGPPPPRYGRPAGPPPPPIYVPHYIGCVVYRSYVINAVNPVVCSEYANRYNCDVSTSYVSDNGTLVYQQSNDYRAMRLVWADCCVFTGPDYVYVYTTNHYGMKIYKKLRRNGTNEFSFYVLVSPPTNLNALYSRRVRIITYNSTVFVSMEVNSSLEETYWLY